MWCICYKTKEPVYYGKGTPQETSCDEFLLCYASRDKECAQQLCDRLMAHKEDRMSPVEGRHIPWDKVDYLFIYEQEEFDTRGD